ncbi:MAG: hypothetical protein COA63_000995 [Methylophaga sp.]|nr:hypothetical protein [Methylophaga sp.]
MSEIKTTNDLRNHLCSAISKIGDGKISKDEVEMTVKLSKQVHESIYSEARMMKLNMELNLESESFGKLSLHN